MQEKLVQTLVETFNEKHHQMVTQTRQKMTDMDRKLRNMAQDRKIVQEELTR